MSSASASCGLALGIGAHDVAVAAMGRRQFADQRLQAQALGFVLDARGHADHACDCGSSTMYREGMLICVVRRAPLLPIGSLTTCTTMSWPSRTSSTIGRGGGRHRRYFHFVAVGRRHRPHDIVGVQERGAVQAHLDERRLHARHHPLHLALVDIADHPRRLRARCALPAACRFRPPPRGFRAG